MVYEWKNRGHGTPGSQFLQWTKYSFLLPIVREQSQAETCQILDDETIQTKSLPEIHRLVVQQSKVPQNFVDKLVALHMGHLSLSVEDLSEYFFHLDRIFNTFAHHSLDFQTLTKNDQAALLIANAPMYYHLYLTR